MPEKVVPKEIAKNIYDIIGGKENLSKVANCMTRLRLNVVDKSIFKIEDLKEVEGVLGVVEQGAQLQIILGPGRVNKVAYEFGELSGLAIGEIDEAAARKEEIKAKNATPFKLFLKTLSSIFIPLIPAFIACGLVTAILNIVLKYNPGFGAGPTGATLKVAGNAVFYGLSLFVGVNAAKEFGGSPMLGGVMAAIISHPDLAKIVIGEKPLVPGRGGIIAVLLVVAFSSFLEKKLRKYVWEALDLFLTPLLVILVSTVVAIFVLQPAGGYISNSIGIAAKSAISGGGAFTGFLLGGTFLPLVMTGLHQGLTPIHVDLLKTTGIDVLLPILAMAGAGQVGAAFAVYIKTKSKRLKKTIISALPIGMLGVGEPLIYGVTLPLVKPFIGACIGGAFGGAAQAFFAVASTSLGLSGIPLTAITNKPLMFIVGLLVAYATGFAATLIIGFDDILD